MRLLLLAGPGGAGKTSIAEKLAQRSSRFVNVVSWTTRQRRPDEPKGSYVFCSEEEFSERENAGGFLETDMFGGFCYGTPTMNLKDRIGICVVTLDGAASLSCQAEVSCRVFVDVPSAQVQRDRLSARGDPPGSIEAKILSAEEERARAASEGWTAIVNADLGEAADAVGEIAERNTFSCAAAN